MKVLTIAGLPGSGKTTAIDAIKDLGIIVTMGDVIRNEVKKRNLEPTGDNIGNIARELREKEGTAIIAKKCVEFIMNLDADAVFVDGVRSLAEVNIFRKFWKFPIIAIVVNEELRFKRLFERGRTDDPKCLEDLKERDNREIQFGLINVIKNADYTILNNTTIEDLKKKMRKIVVDIINHY
ncbi:MAG: AAA family ATPase [Candidatus Thorarchaeota archaeon]